MSAFVAAACRSPIAPRDGALASLSIEALAAPVVTALLDAAGLGPEAVDEVILSNALGAGGNPARRVALAAGLPERVAGLSTDRQCAGGLDALLLARALVLSGAAEVVIAGGAESYSRRPLRLHTFADGRPPEPYDQAPFTPWPDRDPDMASAADALARAIGISRAEQDAWAVESHAKARAAAPVRGEVVPVAGVARDTFTRRLTPALCARAPVVSGSITAANAAVAADGAAFCLVVSERVARRLAGPALRLLAAVTQGSDPLMPARAPVGAIDAALRQAGLAPGALAVAEVMEAYAVQAIACVRQSGLDPARVNPGGGGLARGHPVGASGAVNAVRLYHQLCATGGSGLATIAAAGGLGSAVVMAG